MFVFIRLFAISLASSTVREKIPLICLSVLWLPVMSTVRFCLFARLCASFPNVLELFYTGSPQLFNERNR